MPAKKPKAKKPIKGQRTQLDRLRTAAVDNNLKLLSKLLESGIEPNVGNGERQTPLYLAATFGHAEAVAMLLQHGANPNLVDADGTTALQLATHETSIVRGTPGHRRVVALLLANGADPDHKNKWGASPRSFSRHCDAEIKKLFAAVKKRPAKTPGPGRRAPTFAELTGTVDENYYWTRHTRLWEALVPSHGQAKTVQGEIIRIVGKLTREAYRNGNMNWDRDCTKMWKFVAKTIDDPEVFTQAERAEVHEWVKTIIRDRDWPDVRGEGSPYYLVTERAVIWVEAHPKPIRHKRDPSITR